MKKMCVEFTSGNNIGRTGKVMSDAFYGDDRKFHVVVLSDGEFIKTSTDCLAPAGDRETNTMKEVEAACQ